MDDETAARIRANVERSRKVRHARQMAAFWRLPAMASIIEKYMARARVRAAEMFVEQVIYGSRKDG